MYIYHDFLLKANSFEEAASKVQRFLQLYELVSYDVVTILKKQSRAGWQGDFWRRVDEGIGQNSSVLQGLIAELESFGYKTIEDLKHAQQGFETKILHTMTHILDGFFGIDSYFFNLVEDSHWLSEGLKEEIRMHPKDYWIIAVEGRSNAEIQGFELKSPVALKGK